MVWLKRDGPVVPRAMVSMPNSAVVLYPRLAPTPTSPPFILFKPRSIQLDDDFGSKRYPRALAQLAGGFEITWGEHPSGITTNVFGDAVDIVTRKSCSGVPARKIQVLHGPSAPSLFRVRPDISKINFLQITMTYKYWAGKTSGCGTEAVVALFPRTSPAATSPEAHVDRVHVEITTNLIKRRHKEDRNSIIDRERGHQESERHSFGAVKSVCYLNRNIMK